MFGRKSSRNNVSNLSRDENRRYDSGLHFDVYTYNIKAEEKFNIRLKNRGYLLFLRKKIKIKSNIRHEIFMDNA